MTGPKLPFNYPMSEDKKMKTALADAYKAHDEKYAKAKRDTTASYIQAENDAEDRRIRAYISDSLGYDEVLSWELLQESINDTAKELRDIKAILDGLPFNDDGQHNIAARLNQYSATMMMRLDAIDHLVTEGQQINQSLETRNHDLEQVINQDAANLQEAVNQTNIAATELALQKSLVDQQTLEIQNQLQRITVLENRITARDQTIKRLLIENSVLRDEKAAQS